MTSVTIVINGLPRRVAADVTVAVALLHLGATGFRRSVSGAPRGPLCAMGTCHECRVTVDGRPGVRTCLEPVREGMRLELEP